MSSAEPPRAAPRLHLLYFALAAFDILTICTALWLNHNATSAFEEAVRASAESSRRQVEIIELARLAQQADAPGNDVFQTRAVAAERARYREAFAQYRQAWGRVSADLNPNTSEEAAIVQRLNDANASMEELGRQADFIFSELGRGNVSRAGGGMALMDRSFASAIANFDQALAIVNSLRADELERQLATARQLRQLEWLVAMAVALIIAMAATFGLGVMRAERAHQEQRASMLREVSAARDRLQHYADDVSHELRGPISKMRLDAEVLLSLDRSPGQYRTGIESILSECQRLSAIVESLLFLARADNALAAAQPHALDATKELTRLIEFFSASAEQAGVALQLEASDAEIWADRSLFQRAVSNLISNALAHTPKGGHITVKVLREDDAVSVEVADDGAGIDPLLLPRVFDRFQRGENRTGGLGLGLAIAKSIMKMHGGDIRLNSKPGAGVRAQLLFPNRKAPARPMDENYNTVISTQ